MYLAILLTAVSQVVLRKGAKDRPTMFRAFFNPGTIIGLSLFVVVTILNVYALRQIELKTMTAWVSLTYLFTILLSRVFLDEALTKQKFIGAALIVFGIIVFTLS